MSSSALPKPMLTSTRGNTPSDGKGDTKGIRFDTETPGRYVSEGVTPREEQLVSDETASLELTPLQSSKAKRRSQRRSILDDRGFGWELSQSSNPILIYFCFSWFSRFSTSITLQKYYPRSLFIDLKKKFGPKLKKKIDQTSLRGYGTDQI